MNHCKSKNRMVCAIILIALLLAGCGIAPGTKASEIPVTEAALQLETSTDAQEPGSTETASPSATVEITSTAAPTETATATSTQVIPTGPLSRWDAPEAMSKITAAMTKRQTLLDAIMSGNVTVTTDITGDVLNVKNEISSIKVSDPTQAIREKTGDINAYGVMYDIDGLLIHHERITINEQLTGLVGYVVVLDTENGGKYLTVPLLLGIASSSNGVETSVYVKKFGEHPASQAFASLGEFETYLDEVAADGLPVVSIIMLSVFSADGIYLPQTMTDMLIQRDLNLITGSQADLWREFATAHYTNETYLPYAGVGISVPAIDYATVNALANEAAKSSYGLITHFFIIKGTVAE